MYKRQSSIDQYKAKNEVLEKEVPQLQEIVSKVWKKEDELKQLKSELAALDRKIQLELAPPATETAEKETEGQQQARPTLGDATPVSYTHLAYRRAHETAKRLQEQAWQKL